MWGAHVGLAGQTCGILARRGLMRPGAGLRGARRPHAPQDLPRTRPTPGPLAPRPFSAMSDTARPQPALVVAISSRALFDFEEERVNAQCCKTREMMLQQFFAKSRTTGAFSDGNRQNFGLVSRFPAQNEAENGFSATARADHIGNHGLIGQKLLELAFRPCHGKPALAMDCGQGLGIILPSRAQRHGFRFEQREKKAHRVRLAANGHFAAAKHPAVSDTSALAKRDAASR